MFILTKRSRNGGVVINVRIFDEENAHIKSRAAYVLLKDKLIVQDEDYLERRRPLKEWLDAREVFLTRRQEENGGNLVCDYCGKEHLDIGGKTPEDLIINNKNKNLGTVDHIQPLYEEGEKFNEDNMCVACKKCNGNKGTKSLEDFLNSLPVETLKKTAPFLIEIASNKSRLKNKLDGDNMLEGMVVKGTKPESKPPVKIKKIILPEKYLKLNTRNLLAYYKAERKRYHRFVNSFVCDCCGEAVWHLYDDEDSKKAHEAVTEKGYYLKAIKEELNKREHIA